MRIWAGGNYGTAPRWSAGSESGGSQSLPVFSAPFLSSSICAFMRWFPCFSLPLHKMWGLMATQIDEKCTCSSVGFWIVPSGVSRGRYRAALSSNKKGMPVSLESKSQSREPWVWILKCKTEGCVCDCIWMIRFYVSSCERFSSKNHLRFKKKYSGNSLIRIV